MNLNKTFSKRVLKISLAIAIITMIVAQQTGQQQGGQMGQMGPPGGSQQGGQMGGQSGNGSSSNSSVCGTTKEAKKLSYSTTSDDDKGSATGYPGGYFQMNTDNCPQYDWTSQSTPNKALVFNKTIKLPLKPKLSTQKIYVGIKGANGATNSSPVMGSIGVSVNGIAIYGNANAQMQDAYITEAKTFDKCGGHPQMQGEYHYHEETPAGCANTDVAGQHSKLFGIMFDGIPIYGSLGDNGVAPTDLDECGGHVDKTNNFYHYHLPANMAFPYTLSCLKGCIYDAQGNNALSKFKQTYATCTQDSKQYDYSSLYNKISSDVIQYSGSSSTSAGTTTSTQVSTPNSFLPPSTPTTSDKINNITNKPTLTKLKSLISNLPTA